MNELITLIMVIMGWIIGMLAIPFSAVLISALVWHYLPNCRYSKWIDDEVLQKEDIGNVSNDWLSERMRK